MKNDRHITSFSIETLLLIAVFLAIILLLTQVFGLGRRESGEARLLTNAVTLAQNAAEVVSASADPQELAVLLDEDGNSLVTADGVEARYDVDMMPDPDGAFCVQIGWQPEQRQSGSLVKSAVIVYYDDRTEPIYMLDTAVFLKEATP